MIQQEPIDIFISCDNRFTWDQMVNSSTGVVIPDAAPTFLLKASDGTTTVSGSTGTMTTIAGKNGGYEGVLPSSVSLTADATYYLQITTSVNGLDDFRRIECKAKYRGLR
jgi:hypothetical protein